MTNKPFCNDCRRPMALVRVLPGWHLVPAVECFQCECGAFATHHATVKPMPAAGPHAEPHLTRTHATPGADLPSDGSTMQPSR